MQMLTSKRPGDIFFWHEKASSSSQIYIDSSLKVFQVKGCLAELSPKAYCRIVWGMARGILAGAARTTIGLGQAGEIGFVIGDSIPVEGW